MEPEIRIEVSGLTALDQMELEQTEEWKQARFQADKTASGKLGQLPLVTMILETTRIVVPAAIGALTVWLTKTRREVTVKMAREDTPDGGKRQTVEIHAKSSQDIASELIEAAARMSRE